jgi:hypothetical protein
MSYRLVKNSALVITLLVLGFSQQSHADFVDNFNSENGGVPQLNYSSFANWNVTVGSVDLIGIGSGFDFYPGNGLYLDLNGSTNVSGTIVTKTSFGPGTYTLSFDLGNDMNIGGPTNFVTVSLGSFNQTFVETGNNVPLTLFTTTVTLTTASVLTFATPASDSDDGGVVLDNVSVISSATVPEPSSLALCGIAGTAGLIIARVRRKRPVG